MSIKCHGMEAKKPKKLRYDFDLFWHLHSKRQQNKNRNVKAYKLLENFINSKIKIL